MSKYPSMTDPESIIMEILWRDGAVTSSGIQKEIRDVLNWSRQTVNTYLNRLVEKNLVGINEINMRTYQYYPTVSRDEYAADRTGSVLTRYYGSLSHMVAGFVKNEKISEKDLDELDQLIQELKKKGGKQDGDST